MTYLEGLDSDSEQFSIPTVLSQGRVINNIDPTRGASRNYV